MACGDGQTIAVASDGSVYGWGCYKDKEGKKWFSPSPGAANPLKDIKRQQNSPMLIDGIKNAVEVGCGSVFNIVLSSDGTVMSWGLGECGELGREVRPMKDDEDSPFNFQNILEDHLTPSLMCSKSRVNRGGKMSYSSYPVNNVRTFGCGGYHALVVTGSDESGGNGGLFSCGLNNYGQLGTGDFQEQTLLTHVSLSYLLQPNTTLVSVKGGFHHSLILSSDGDMFAFGRGDSCQLGLLEMSQTGGGTAGACSKVPRLVSIPLDDSSSSITTSTAKSKKSKLAFIKQISCGSNHNFAVTDTNDVYSWGYGDLLALGNGKDQDEPIPKKLNLAKAKNISPDFKVSMVVGGGQHSAIIGTTTRF